MKKNDKTVIIPDGGKGLSHYSPKGNYMLASNIIYDIISTIDVGQYSIIHREWIAGKFRGRMRHKNAGILCVFQKNADDDIVRCCRRFKKYGGSAV